MDGGVQARPAPVPGAPRRTGARLAVAVMAVAVAGLGAVGLWSALVLQNDANSLARAGLQTTGQLRATQALDTIRAQVTVLEGGVTAPRMAKLQAARLALPQGLSQMEIGDDPMAVQVARNAKPVARELDAAIDVFLLDPMSDVNNHVPGQGNDKSEQTVNHLTGELEALLGSSAADPTRALAPALAEANRSERVVRLVAFGLTPVGLLGVVASGWLLRKLRRRAEAALRESQRANAAEARTDHLTGLPNRLALNEELDRRTAAGESFVVAVADLNDFKRFNDTYGHPDGDALLVRLGEQLAEAVARRGMAARLGGDEFCVAVDDCVPSELELLVRQALREVGDDYEIGAACGLAAVPTDAPDPVSALRLANMRLYAAKAALANRAARAARAASPYQTSPYQQSGRAGNSVRN